MFPEEGEGKMGDKMGKEVMGRKAGKEGRKGRERRWNGRKNRYERGEKWGWTLI